jgi:hypothetical protein
VVPRFRSVTGARFLALALSQAEEFTADAFFGLAEATAL